MHKPPVALDISYALETPEGVDLQVDLAGPVVRALAFLIDLSIRLVFMLLLLIGVSLLGGKLGWAVWLLAYFLIEWWYPVVYEVLRQGRTPGKKAMGIQVVNDDLTPVSWGASLTRNLLRAADFLPSGYALGLIVMSVHPEFRRLGDIAGATLVIHDPLQTPVLPPLGSEAATPPPFDLNEDEQTALVEFLHRQAQLAPARQAELAAILATPMNRSADGMVGYLRGIGAWLLGSR